MNQENINVKFLFLPKTVALDVIRHIDITMHTTNTEHCLVASMAGKNKSSLLETRIKRPVATRKNTQ